MWRKVVREMGQSLAANQILPHTLFGTCSSNRKVKLQVIVDVKHTLKRAKNRSRPNDPPTITSHMCKMILMHANILVVVLQLASRYFQNARYNKPRKGTKEVHLGEIQREPLEKRSRPLFGFLGELGVDRKSTPKWQQIPCLVRCRVAELCG